VLDWNDLRFVLALYRERTLARAARRLGVEHSTVGRRIAALEAKLGARLFDRTPDGYVLTAAGRRALPPLERIADTISTLERRIVGDDDRLSGEVRVTASELFGSSFLAPRLGAFKKRFPDIALVLLTTNQSLSLARREADVAIRMFRPTQPNIVARKIGEVGFAIYAGKKYLKQRPVRDGAKLDGHDVIAFEHLLGDTPAGQWMTEAASSANIVCSCNSFSAAAALAADGFGLAVLPRFLAAASEELKRVPAGEVAFSEIWLAVHLDLQRSARVRAVMEFLSELVLAEAPRLRGLD
jgi:DNA-binding transcriptional LysR family regulator